MKKCTMFLLIGCGLALLLAGLCLIKLTQAASQVQMVVPYCMVGIGCGAFGHGMGEWIGRQAMKNSPDIQREIAIAQKDERNIEISNRAKSKAYDAMVYIFGVLLPTTALLQSDIRVTLLLVLAYLMVIGISIFYRIKYDKEM